MARRAKPTPKKLRDFLELLSGNGNVTLSAQALNLERTRLYEIRLEDPVFRAAWAEAMEEAADHLEAEARRRAVEGLVQKKFDKDGVPVIDRATGEQYFERAYSDTLLIFLLKGARPEKFRDNQRLEHTGPGGDPLPAASIVNVYLPSNGRDIDLDEEA